MSILQDVATTSSPSNDGAPTTSAQVLAVVRELMSRGDYFAAIDAASIPLSPTNASPESLDIRYLRALGLARSGATDHARSELALAVDLADGLDLDARVDEDLRALGARIAKDEAAQAAVDRRAKFAAAAAAYQAIADRLDRPYACVNAATMWMIAGDVERAIEVAHRAIALARASADRFGSDAAERYWNLATEAEALLVIGDVDASARVLAQAAEENAGDLAARASTRRQIRMLGRECGLDVDAVLASLPQPEVLHYTGHMTRPSGVPARFPADAEADVAFAVERFFDGSRVGFAYGGLACGADVVIAEAALRSGAQLHVVLPFGVDEFLATSVTPGGPGWEPRFRQCLDAAASVLIASDSAYGGDDALFSFASHLSMGAALNRAVWLESDASQLAVWDGNPVVGEVGTSADVDTWRRAGGRTQVIPVRSTSTELPAEPSGHRRIRSILFGDFSGFSRLRDEHVEAFMDVVMASVAGAIEPFDDEIVVRNTWGDGVMLVIETVDTGARCALAIQEALAAIDLAAAGLPADMGLRLAGHVAPVIDVVDPLLRRPHVMGRELTRAARMEPMTPTGEVYVSAAFAGFLALEPRSDVVAEYIGVMTTAKNFESAEVFRLRRRHQGDDARPRP